MASSTERDCCRESKSTTPRLSITPPSGHLPRNSSSSILERLSEEVEALVQIHRVPSYLRELHIMDGYRVNFSFQRCLKSIFQIHNETLNVWTHLLGVLIFLGLTFYTCYFLSSHPSDLLSKLHHANSTSVAFLVSPSPSSPSSPSPSPSHLSSESSPFYSLPPSLFPTTRDFDLEKDADHFYPNSFVGLLSHQHNRDRETETKETESNGEKETERKKEEDEDSHRKHFELLLSRHQQTLDALIELRESVKSTRLGKFMLATRDNFVEIIEHNIRLIRESNPEQHLSSVKQSLKENMEKFQILASEVRHSLRETLLPIIQEEILQLSHRIQDRAGLDQTAWLEQLHTSDWIQKVQKPKWPIVIFSMAAVCCMLCSSMFHLFCCHFQKSTYSLLGRLDYSGISILIAGSFIPIIYYVNSFGSWRIFYILGISSLGVVTMAFSFPERFSHESFRSMRTMMFIGMSLFGVFPIVHMVVLFGASQELISLYFYIFGMASLYLLGAIIYLLRVPERFFPGKFDILFSSHQFWHMCVVGAALVHYVLVVRMWNFSHFSL